MPWQKEIAFQNPGEKDLRFIFFKIWSSDSSSYTSYGFLIAKGRTLNSQNSARISIDLESVSDCVIVKDGVGTKRDRIISNMCSIFSFVSLGVISSLQCWPPLVAHQGKLLTRRDMIVLASLNKQKILSSTSQIYITTSVKEGGM